MAFTKNYIDDEMYIIRNHTNSKSAMKTFLRRNKLSGIQRCRGHFGNRKNNLKFIIVVERLHTSATPQLFLSFAPIL